MEGRMLRFRAVCFSVLVVASGAFADSLTFTTEQDYKDGIAAKYQQSAEDVADFEGWDDYEDGTTISNGSVLNGVKYEASTSVLWFSVDRNNSVTDNYGSRSPENALGLELDLGWFGTYSTNITSLDTVTFTFLQPIDSFGISFLNKSDGTADNRYTITASSTFSDFSQTVESGSDPFYDDRGKFAGIIADQAFNTVTISVTGEGGFDKFVLDNMWSTAAETGLLGGVLRNGDANTFAIYENLLGGSTLLNPQLSSLFPGHTLGNTTIDAETLATIILAGEFAGASPHLYTSNEEPIDEDIQFAVTAAFTDLQFGGFQFHEYVNGLILAGDPRPELMDLLLADLSMPGSTIENMPADVWLGFVATFNPNQMIDPFTGLPMPDPDFETRLANWWNDPEIQASVANGSIQEIIFPHDDTLDFAGLGVNIQYVMGPDGTYQLTSGNFSAAIVPEPGTVATLGAAMALAFVVVRRRKRRGSATA
jgi:hypothetical protein